MLSFAPELPAYMISLSALNSKPVGGLRFKIKLLPPRAVGVAGSGAAVVLSVSFEAARAAPAPAGGEGPTPPTLGSDGEKD